MRERANVGKKIRFDVFKRDSFKCQYCGAEAPSVVLHVDHIKPVAEGGDDNILNLVTSCEGCNLGKGATPLSDDAAVSKARAQMEELQERREQLEMMMEWRSGLQGLAGTEIQIAEREWASLAPGYAPNDVGKRNLGKAIRMFGLRAVLRAMQTAADQYLEWKQDGTATKESWEIAFKKVGGICKYDQIRERDPEGAKWLHIQNSACKKLWNAKVWQIKEALGNARAAGLAIERAWECLRVCDNGWQFVDALNKYAADNGGG